MSLDQMPSRQEVMGWSPQRLADYLRKMNLSGCDKAVMKNSISGARFVNLSENDLQRFPKLHAPIISKISAEINKKEEKRSIFSKKTTHKHQEPDFAAEVHGWGEDEFDDEEFDDDYESPYSGDEGGSGGDYESPNEDVEGANDYEPPPSEPADDAMQKLCPTMPKGDYIDNPVSSRGPPAVSPRPPASTLSVPREASRREPSPHSRTAKIPPEPPQVFRGNKPGRSPRPTATSGAEGHGAQAWRSQHDDSSSLSKPPVPPPSSINRSNSSARPPNRFDGRREQQTHDEVVKHNTFPLHNKSLPPRPGPPGPPPRHGDSLPPNMSSAGSHKKQQPALDEHKGSFMRSEGPSFHPPPSTTAPNQGLDPRWYVGKVTRGQAEGCLKQLCMDGAYLVRDSTRQLSGQPFTLMVFYHGKVYNIQIRQQQQHFLLGTGLKVQESFPSVSAIILHFSHSPLLLIDAKNRCPGRHHCLLAQPAGGCMAGQSWT